VGTVIAATVVAFPLMHKTSLGALRQIDSNLLACSRTLGASEWTVFWRIMLPLAKPGIIAGTLLAFARALGEFGATLMLAGNIPGKTQTIPIAIFFAAESGAMDKALIWVLVILALSRGVITAVNFWSEDHQPHPKEWGYRNKARLRGLSEGNFWSDENSDNVPGPIPHLLYGGDNQDKFELIVDIQKQLPGFLLDVSFTTYEGALGLLGASGAGKSMILRCIAGLSTPDRGRIILNGRVLFDGGFCRNGNFREQNVKTGDNVIIGGTSKARNLYFLLFPSLWLPRRLSRRLPLWLSYYLDRELFENL